MEEMQATKVVGQWLTELSDITNTQLSLDEKNYCYFDFNGVSCVVEVIPEEDRFLICSPITTLPHSEEERASYMRLAMALNINQLRLGKPVLTLDPRNNQLLLCYGESIANVDAVAFALTLDCFSESVLEISTLLRKNVFEFKDRENSLRNRES